MKKSILILSFLASISINAATIKGKLLDENKEPLIGAHVLISSTQKYAVVGLDGSFVIGGVAPGSYVLEASFVGYKAQQKSISINGENESSIIDFQLEPETTQLEEVTVTGKAEGGSDVEARKTERNSLQVMNIISAKTIELSPDLTVANVAQRVSGVSIVRNSNGDPQYAIVRGMDKRYNYTLVNGVKIPSPDNQNRYIPLDIFPSQLLERLEVSKSLTPNMEGDAIGGVVNMVMKSAPEQLTIKGDLQVGYNQINVKQDFIKFDPSNIRYQSPYELYGKVYQARITDFTKQNVVATPTKPLPDIIASISVGNRFFKNKLGVLLGGSFQNSYRGTKSDWYSVGTNFNGNVPQFNELQERTYSTHQQRYAFHSRLDYVINPQHKLNLYSGYYQLLNDQVRDMTITQLDGRFYRPDQGNQILSFSTRTRRTDQSILNTTLQGTHQFFREFKVNWSAVYSKAKSDQPDNANFNRDGGLINFVAQPIYVSRRMPRRWEHNTDEDYTGYLNLIFTPSFLGEQGELSVGGMYRDKKRSNFFNEYQFDPNPANQIQGKDWNTFADVKQDVVNPSGGTAVELNYDAQEKLLDYYVQAKFTLFGTTQVVTGVRSEVTDQGYQLKFPKQDQAPTNSQKYTDFLPSLMVKHRLNDRMNLRGSYFKSISRPGYFEIVPYRVKNEDFDEVGNPDLKRVKANNYDLRFEFFPSSVDQLLIGTFYKNIQDPIEYALASIGNVNQLVLQAGNFGTANNFGFELDYTKYFNKFGIRGNYTFTQSSITSSKSLTERENPNDQTSQLITKIVDQTRPLQGQAQNIGNLSLLYKDQKAGVDGQLAFVYTGSYIESISAYLDNDMWTKPILQMDISGEKKVGKHFEVFGRVQNLLNSPFEVVIRKPYYGYGGDVQYKGQTSATETLIRRDLYYMSFRVGLRYSLL